MSLDKLTKKLYEKKDKLKDRKPPDDAYDATKYEQPKDQSEKYEYDILQQQGTTEPTEQEAKGRNRKMMAFGGAVVAVLVAMVLLVLIYYRFVGSAFVEEKVIIEIDGPEEVRSAEEASYTIRVRNENRVSLRDSKFRLAYPDDMVIQHQDWIQQEGFNQAKVDIGEVKANGTKEFQVGFEPFGPRDRQVYLNASLVYQPANFSSDFEKSVQRSIMIKSSPISIALVPTKQAASGDIIDVDVIIKNDSTKQYENLELRMEYPDGFTFNDSDAFPIRDNRVWALGKIGSQEQKKIKITGTVEGVAESLKKFKAAVGQTRDDDRFLVYTELEDAVRIIAGRVELIQEISEVDKVYAGTEVRYKIKFKNTSDVPLRDMILTEQISSRVIDLESFVIEGGYFDSSKGTITWKAAQVPELKVLQPQQSGEVKFKLKVLGQFPMKNENDKNFSIVSHVEIESLDVNSPIWSNKKIKSAERSIKINSKLIASASFAYNDGEIPNTGPVPLKSRNETTVTARINVLNTSNDLKNVILRTSLPPGVSWKDNYLPEDPGIEFNSRTNELKWVMGSLEAGVGFISPVKTMAFQIGITPAENQVGRVIQILDEINVEALDAYTGNPVEYRFRSSSMYDIADVQGQVVE